MTPPIAAPAAPDEVPTWTPSKSEWEQFVQAQLNELGLTYEQLASQAAERNFQSPEALTLWMMIG